MYDTNSTVQTKNTSQAGINFILAFFAVAIYSFVKISVFQKSFYTNDQLVMRDIVSGVYSGASDVHLVYIMASLGAIFKGLYGLFSSVNWYDIFMLAVHPVCLALSSFYIVRSSKEMANKVIATVLFCMLFLSLNEWFIVMNEYTVNAGILCATGLFCFILADGINLFSYIPTIVCLVLTLLLRRQMLLMMLPLAVLLVFLKILTSEKRKSILAVIVTAIICVVCITIESNAYSPEGWRTFKKYNAARTDIVDFYGFPSFENIESKLEEIGMDETEYCALTNAISLLPDVDEEKLSIIAAESKSLHDNYSPIWPVSEESKYNIRLAIHELKGSIIGRLILISAAFLFVVSVIVFAEKNHKTALLFILTGGMSCLYTVAVVIVFTLIGRFPERISYPLYYANFVVLIGLLFAEIKYVSNSIAKRISLTVYAVACCGLIILNFPKSHRAVIENAAYWDGYISEAGTVQEYCTNNAGKVYYISGSIANYACDYMLNNTYTTADNYITMGYWTLGSELFEKRCDRVLDDSLFASLIAQGNVYYIAPSSSDIEWLREIYEEYYGDVSIEVVDTISSTLRELEVYSVSEE